VTWYLLPLAAVISLVYSATRYESPSRIVRRAGSLFIQILIGMAVILGVLAGFSFRL
jgi:hypothetical protein